MIDWSQVVSGETIFNRPAVITQEGRRWLFIGFRDQQVVCWSSENSNYTEWSKSYVEHNWVIEEKWEDVTHECELSWLHGRDSYILQLHHNGKLIRPEYPEYADYKIEGMKIFHKQRQPGRRYGRHVWKRKEGRDAG